MKLIAGKNRKPIIAVVAMSALAAPFLETISVQAAPPDHAPAWGRRDKNKKNKPGKGKPEKGDRPDRDNRPDDDRRNITLTGVVNQDYRGDDFSLRSSDGRTYHVIMRNEPVRLSRNDLVEVRGWTEGNIFVANRVRILNNTGEGNNNAQNINISGIVTSDLRGEVFEIRGTNGRNYIVVARNEPLRLSRNDSVQVQGRLDRDGKTILANRVTITRNNGNPGNTNGLLNFYGTVTRVASRYRIDVRADNNRNYAVSSVNALSSNLSFGDRVHVVGVSTGNDTVRANQVSITSNVPGGAQGTAVNFPGRVESVSYAQGLATLRVRGDNGTVYLVRYRTGVRFNVGERVRVVGRVNGQTVVATSITR